MILIVGPLALRSRTFRCKWQLCLYPGGCRVLQGVKKKKKRNTTTAQTPCFLLWRPLVERNMHAIQGNKKLHSIKWDFTIRQGSYFRTSHQHIKYRNPAFCRHVKSTHMQVEPWQSRIKTETVIQKLFSLLLSNDWFFSNQIHHNFFWLGCYIGLMFPPNVFYFKQQLASR